MIVWKSASGRSDEQRTRALISDVMYLHTTFKDEIWLWRGQADGSFGIEPGMHTRVKRTPHKWPDDESAVRYETQDLLAKVRDFGLDTLKSVKLPDMALLALLQHHGAATPLLDVTVDPFVAMWMVAFSSASEPAGEDDRPGLLFAVRKPPPSRTVSALDARPYFVRWSNVPDIVSSLGNDLWWYQPPDVTERLRIRRGSFLFGRFSDRSSADTTLPITTVPPENNWLRSRFASRGMPGQPTRANTSAVAFSVTPGMKRRLRDILQVRAGLDIPTMFPTPWEMPFIEQFAVAYGRGRALDLVNGESPH